MSDVRSLPFLVLVTLAGCAASREPAVHTAPPPLPTVARAPDPPVWSDPMRRPTLAFRTPNGWLVSGTQPHGPGEIVLVHGSGAAMITVALRTTDDRALADVAEDMLTGMGPDASSSPISAAASGDAAWFSWTRHPTPHRTSGSHGKVRLVRFPTVPERMAVVSGTWQYGLGRLFSPDFDRVAESVQLR